MGNFGPIFLAFIQYTQGVYIFKAPKFEEGFKSGPVVSSFLVLISIFLLSRELLFCPNCFRFMGKWAGYIVQYVMAAFLIEYFMAYFWFPLESQAIKILPIIANYSEDILNAQGWNCDFVCEFMRSNTAGAYISHTLSILILVSTLHALRMINLNILIRDGLQEFLVDATSFVRLSKIKKCLRFNNKKKPSIISS